MALIAMAIWDTVENDRYKYTYICLNNLYAKCDYIKNDIILVDNDSTDKRTQDLLADINAEGWAKILSLDENVGTAKAINKAFALRRPGQHCVKMDNDVYIYDTEWVEILEECIERCPEIGIIGLKRKDLAEHPNHEDANLRSELVRLPHKPGEKRLVVEQVKHVMGTCQMYNSALLDKIGYLKQLGLYGFDDALASLRSQLAGFANVFYPHIEIAHLDVGGDAYCEWKVAQADKAFAQFQELANSYINGTRPLWENAE